MSLSKEQILNAKDYDIEKVDVPEWGGEVFLKPLSGTVRNQLVYQVQANKDLEKVQLQVLVNSICDEDGNLLFTEKDILALGKKSSTVIARLEAIASKISGLTPDAEDEALKN